MNRPFDWQRDAREPVPSIYMMRRPHAQRLFADKLDPLGRSRRFERLLRGA